MIPELDRIYQGDCRAIMRGWPAGFIHCCVTSPPYWGLRDYNIEPQVWGGDPEHEHRWGAEIPGGNRGGSGTPTDKNNRGEGYGRDAGRCNFCECGAWLGSLGLEPSPKLFIEHIVEIFQEVYRILRNDGTIWVNLGDSYASTWACGRRNAMGSGACDIGDRLRRTGDGIKEKDLIGIPWMVALALRDDGWYLRQDIIWHKPNPMPESVEDRCTKAHEYLFLLSKSPRYYYDSKAIEEPSSMLTHARGNGVNPKATSLHGWAHGPGDHSAIGHARKSAGMKTSTKFGHGPGWRVKQNESFSAAVYEVLPTRNKRSVWTIPTEPYAEAHFATYPRALVSPCVQAGTSEHGVCAACGAPWGRIVHKTRSFESGSGRSGRSPEGKRGPQTNNGGETKDIRRGPVVHRTTTGWEPACKCTGGGVSKAIVLDPFMGAGTTALVAAGLNRQFIGCELNQDYIAMAERRVASEKTQVKLF